MKKEEFLEKLREKLSVLEESEINDIINEYSEHINEKKKTKKKEEKIIEEFGDIDELASDILKAYKINDNYSKKGDDFNSTAKKYFDKFEDVINKIVKKFSSASFGDIIKFIIEIFIICVLIGLIKLPFNFVEDIINSLFYNWIEPLDTIFPTIVTFIIEILYILVAFFMFITIFKERYLCDEKDLDEKVLVKENNIHEEIKESKKVVHVKKSREHKSSAFEGLTNFCFGIFKILICFMSIPLLFTFIFSFAGLILSIIFSFKYFAVIGIIIMMIGIILGHIWLITIIYNFIFNKSNNGTFLLISFILSLALIGSGFGYSVMKLTDINYTSISESGLPYEVKEYTYDLDQILNNNNLDFDIRTDSDINIIIDNSLGNNVRLEVEYIKSLMKPMVYRGTSYDDLRIYYNIKTKDALEYAIKTIKNKKIYDLSDLDLKVNIYVSEANKDKILIND